MSKTAVVRSGVIAEILVPVDGFALDECFPASVLADTFEVPDTAEPGWVLREGGFAPPSGPGLAELQAAKASAVNAKRDALIAGGYQHNFGGTAGIRTLDQRSAEDAINWLGLKGVADAMIASGNGAELIGIRDAGDETFSSSATVVSSAMVTMGIWRSTVIAHSWVLKDAITAAEDEAALEAVDIEVGWPD